MRPTLRPYIWSKILMLVRPLIIFGQRIMVKEQKTRVHIKVKNTGNNYATFNVKEDVKGYADNWIWNRSDIEYGWGLV
jgi:hypothetical protein